MHAYITAYLLNYRNIKCCSTCQNACLAHMLKIIPVRKFQKKLTSKTDVCASSWVYQVIQVAQVSHARPHAFHLSITGDVTQFDVHYQHKFPKAMHKHNK